MTSRTVPEHRIVTCDGRGTQCQGTNHSHRGALTLRDTAFDYQGSPVGDASLQADLCDPCLAAVRTAIEAAMLGEKRLLR